MTTHCEYSDHPGRLFLYTGRVHTLPRYPATDDTPRPEHYSFLRLPHFSPVPLPFMYDFFLMREEAVVCSTSIIAASCSSLAPKSSVSALVACQDVSHLDIHRETRFRRQRKRVQQMYPIRICT